MLRKQKDRLFIKGRILLMEFFVVLCISGCIWPGNTNHAPERTRFASSLKTPLVLSRHELAKEAGYRVLASGGNAFDAFIAVTAVENVVSSGYVTFAGLLSVLLYHAETGELQYLDAGYNSVLDPDGVYRITADGDGKKVVVPGVIAGLESLSKRYGRLSLTEVLKSAIAIARDGFTIDESFANYIAAETEKIKRTEYGKQTFFPEGKALCKGDILKQPELAKTLANIATQGAAYMYQGEWAADCVRTVQNQGGLMTMKDLALYRPTWSQPWEMSYRGYVLYSSSGRCMYGLWVLLALKILEHTNLYALGHSSTSAETMEILIRTVEAVTAEKWLRKYKQLSNREWVSSRLTPEYTNSIWERVKQGLGVSGPTEPPGSCTLCSIVADSEGNVVSGKHSINSDLWGNGLFVGGVLLNGSGDMLGRDLGPGQRRTQGAPNFLVFKNGKIKYACGTFSFSNPQAAMQFLVNLLDFKVTASQAANLPRFGSFPYDMKTGNIDFSKYDLDKRIGKNIVKALEKQGIQFNQINPKLGKGCIVEFFSDGTTSCGWDWGN